MKKLSFIIVFFSFCLTTYCQELNPDKGDFNLSYSAIIGQNLFANRMGVGYDKWLNEDVGIRFGISTTDFAFRCPYQSVENKAPYSAKGKQLALNASVDYKVSNKMLLSFSAYFSTMNLWSMNSEFGNNQFYTKAVNASLRYIFSNDSFIDLSLSFIETNQSFIPPFYSPTSFWLP